MRSPGFQSSPMATVAMPSEVFFTSAISDRSRADQPGGGHTQALVGCQPLVVVQAAELEAVVGQVASWRRRRALHSGATAA